MARRIEQDPKKGFAQRLRMARAQKYPTMKAMAEAIGIESETYRTYERGEKEPNIQTLQKIIVELNIDADFLIMGKLPEGRRAG